jgi:hypothetical protein
MTSTLGWPWTHYFVAIFAAVMLPLIIFLVPETAYRRDSNLDTDTNMTRYQASTSLDDLSPNENGNGKTAHHQTTDSTRSTSTSQPTRLFSLTNLSPFNGRKDPTPFWKLLLRPFPLFLHPSIFWAMLTQGLLIGWTVLIGIVLAAIMIGPPLWFNEVQTGYMYGGPVVGALLGFILAGVLSDPSARWLTKRNRGVQTHLSYPADDFRMRGLVRVRDHGG